MLEMSHSSLLLSPCSSLGRDSAGICTKAWGQKALNCGGEGLDLAVMTYCCYCALLSMVHLSFPLDARHPPACLGSRRDNLDVCQV